MGRTEPTTLANGDVNQPKGSNSFNVIAEIRRNYANKLEEVCGKILFWMIYCESIVNYPVP